jgi:hypothetical protein
MTAKPDDAPVVGPSVNGLDVVVIGPIEALSRVCARLRESGDLVEADPVVADADDPTHGSCCIRMTGRSGSGRGGSGNTLG